VQLAWLPFMHKEDKNNLMVFLKVGLPYTIAGALVIFLGIYVLKHLFAENEHLTLFIFIWLAFFWLCYQPLFRKKIKSTKKNLGKT
jgi:uncharacterized membrane protein YfcA